MRWLIVAVVVLLACSASASTRDVIQGTPGADSLGIRDNWMSWSTRSQNNSTDTVLVIAKSAVNGQTAVACIRPQGIYQNYKNKSIVSCSLFFYCAYASANSVGGSRWSVGVSRAQYYNTGQTWNKYDTVSASDSAWSPVITSPSIYPNGVYEGFSDAYITRNNVKDTSSSTAFSTDSLKTGVWRSFDCTMAVQGWATHRNVEGGLIIYQHDYDAVKNTQDTCKIFSTDYTTDASKRPYLVINWDTTSRHERWVKDPRFFRDTYLDSINSTTNYGTTGSMLLRTKSNAWSRVALFGFVGVDSVANDSDYMMQGHILDTARWIFIDSLGAAASARVHRQCLRAWTETGATWTTYDGSNNWTTAGGQSSGNDFNATLVDSVSQANAVDKIDSINITSYMQSWWTDAATAAKGFMRWDKTALSTTRNITVYSRDGQGTGAISYSKNRPALHIFFHDAPVANKNTRRRRLMEMSDAMIWKEQFCIREIEE